MSKRIFAVDPGETNGLAFGIVSPGVPAEEWDLRTKQLTHPVGVWQLIEAANPDVVVIEGFNTGGRVSVYGLITIKVVGYLQHHCAESGIPCEVTEASQRLSKLPQARRLASKKYELRHSADALAHLLAYVERTSK